MLFILLLPVLAIFGFLALKWLAEMASIQEIVHDEMSLHEPRAEALAFIQKRLKEKKEEAAGKRSGREIIYRKSDFC